MITYVDTSSLLKLVIDEDGSERFGLHLKDLDADTTLGDLVTNISGSVAWAEDGRFTPSVARATADAAHRDWVRAVDRARGWARE